MSFVERSSLSQRVPYRRFHCIHTLHPPLSPVLTGEKELSVGGDGHGDGSHADNDKGEGFEIVDSSDSEDEEEEEEEIMSGASIEVRKDLLMNVLIDLGHL